MLRTILLTLLVSSVAAQTGEPHGSEESKHMGPVAFLWPPDREWGAAQDNTSPCGSSAGVTNRTDFPTAGGAIALVIQDDSWEVHVSITYDEDPTNSSQFTTLIQPSRIPEVDEGHQCYKLPPPTTQSFPLNATLQLTYTSDFGGSPEGNGKNETYYACADIRYVANLTPDMTEIPCFNTTKNEFVPVNDTKTTVSVTGSAATATGTAANVVEASASGLSGGGIAGVVVGVVVGLAMVVIGAILVYRRKQRAQRARGVEASKRRMAEGEEVELRNR